MKLAVCIPTYNRVHVIREFLKLYAASYWTHGIDIFIYDSSENDETKSVVEKYQQNDGRLYYVRIDSTVHSNLKVYHIFKEFGGNGNYDYLWVCSDSIRWKESVLTEVDNYMEQGYDIIIPNYRDVEKIGVREYDDCNRLFEDCAWHMTLYGAVILKTAVMLQNVDWDYLEKKYCVPDSINHSHVAFYFEKLLQISQWRAVHFNVPLTEFAASGLKTQSGWHKDTFFVWCHCWPSMIEKLPESYHNKKKVIKKSGVNSQILTYKNFVNLRSAEILNKEIYWQFRKEWHKLTNVPSVVIWFLVKLSPNVLRKMDIKRLIRVRKLKREMKNFCQRYPVVYIFGAGKKAQRYTEYLDEMGIDFKGYLVTDLDSNAKRLNDHTVFRYNKDLLKEEKTGILLALNQINAYEVWNGELSGIDKERVFDEFSV